jgi:LysM repeat protein
MPLRRGYDKEREEGESVGLLDEEPIRLESLHYKKREDHGSPGRRKAPEPTLQCDIQPSDTLLSLSLKYNVPIAELKRVNNILTDQGFYALKRIKIPVKPYSLLLPDVHGSERGQNNNGWLVESNKASPTFSSNISSRVSTACSSPYSELGSPGEEEGEGNLSLGEQDQLLFHESKDKKKVKRFLKGMDKDLDRIKEKHSELISVAEEQVLIKEPIKFPLRASQIPTEDPGCSNRVLCCWCGIVGFLIVVVFVVLVSLMGNPHDTHHDNWGTSNLTALPKL